MSGLVSIYSADSVSDREVAHFVGLSGEYSPLRRVATHVVRGQIARAYVVVGNAVGFPSDGQIIFEVERELVRLYVGPDFCGLCGRYTDHQGEH